MYFPASLRDVFSAAFPISEVRHPGYDFPLSAVVAQNAEYLRNRSHLLVCIDTLLKAVDFETEEETLTPQNIESTKAAFKDFLQAADLPLSQFAFDDILRENQGPNEYRGDGKVPNWYHFFRQVLPKLSVIKAGLISEQVLNANGGLDTLIAATLYHDSWEDHGQNPTDIFSKLQKYIDQLAKADFVDAQREYNMQHQAAAIGWIVDLCTRKTPLLDAKGNFIVTNGKTQKEDRFGGDLNMYYNNHLEHPFAPWIKWDDTSEGTSTRLFQDTFERGNEDKFSVASNLKYATKVRSFYSRRANDALAIAKWPEFKNVFESADSMLGINLVILETMNDYAADQNLRPSNAQPANIALYLPDAWAGYRYVPLGWRSDRIQTDRIEGLAAQLKTEDGKETNKPKRYPRIGGVLEHVIYPAMPHFRTDKDDPEKQDLNPLFDSVPL